MKKAIITSLLVAAMGNVHAANIASDNASDSVVYSTWSTGDNGGSGFGAWTISTTGAANVYVGGTSAGAQSFGLWADPGGSSSARRDFTGGGLLSGQTISFKVGHTSNIDNGAEIGFSLLSGGVNRITFKFVGGQSNWLMNDGGSGDFGAGQGYLANTPINFSFTYNGGSSYSYSFGTGSGNNYTATAAINNIDGVVFRNNGQGAGHNFGVDDLQIVPEPSTASLMALGATGLFALRRRRNA